jgi:hypothetical protein
VRRNTHVTRALLKIGHRILGNAKYKKFDEHFVDELQQISAIGQPDENGRITVLASSGGLWHAS